MKKEKEKRKKKILSELIGDEELFIEEEEEEDFEWDLDDIEEDEEEEEGYFSFSFPDFSSVLIKEAISRDKKRLKRGSADSYVA